MLRENIGGRRACLIYPVLHRLERLGHVEARWEVAEAAAVARGRCTAPLGGKWLRDGKSLTIAVSSAGLSRL